MSLINKVLNDLDQRNPSGQRGNGSAVVVPRRFPRWWIALLIIVLIIAGLVSWSLLSSAPEKTQAPASKPEQHAVISTVEVEPPAQEKPEAQTVPASSQPAQPAAEQKDVQKTELVLPPPIELTSEKPKAHAKGSFSKQSVKLSAKEVAERELQKAEQAQQQGLFSDAAGHYRAVLNAQPQWHDARKEWAALEFGQGQASQALAILREGLTEYPQAHSLRLLAASMLEKQAQPTLALQLLQQAAPDAAELPQYYQLQANLAQQQGELAIMRDSYQALVSAQPDNGRWYLGLALALRKQQPEQALAAFEQAAVRIEHTETLNFIAEQIKHLRSQHAASTP